MIDSADYAIVLANAATCERQPALPATHSPTSGLLPICASCKKIRDDQGYWNQIEVYLKSHSEVEFTHGMCPECLREWFPGMPEKQSP